MPARKLNRVPRATYRFQFNAGFTLGQARELVPYLKQLGISDLYASPLFQAGPQSTHGYDICGYNKINPNLGTLEDFHALSREVRAAGMGLLLDMVPNHMGNHRSNEWWRDVLQNGPDSKFARYFDINWNSPNPLLTGKLLLPVLGDRYSAVLEKGEIQLRHEEGEYRLVYYENWFPLSPESITWFKQEFSNDPQAVLNRINGKQGVPESWNALHQLLQMQHYRLAYWRVAAEEINYRRFFDVTELVSVRVEDPKVFEATHQLTFELVNS